MSEKVFDEFAEEYDSWYDRHREEFIKEVECFKAIIDAPKPWLEIGVGSGRFAEALGIEYGIDPSKNMVRLAQKRGIRAVVGYGEQLPYKDETFGAVFIIVTICFVKDPIRVLKETWRVLKPGGKLYMGIIPRDSPLGKEYMEKSKRGHRFYSLAKFYTIGEIREMLERCGFEITKIRSAGLKKKDFVCIEAIKR